MVGVVAIADDRVVVVVVVVVVHGCQKALQALSTYYEAGRERERG